MLNIMLLENTAIILSMFIHIYLLVLRMYVCFVLALLS